MAKMTGLAPLLSSLGEESLQVRRCAALRGCMQGRRAFRVFATGSGHQRVSGVLGVLPGAQA